MMTQTYEGAFIEHSEMAKLSIVEAPEALDMPDPEQVRAATEMMMQTMFDVLRDTRMEAVCGRSGVGFRQQLPCRGEAYRGPRG
jgi:hypothetical protein